MQFWQPRRHMLDSWPEDFGSKTEKKQKSIVPSKKWRFSNLFQWTRRMQFRLFCRTIFELKPFFLRSMSKRGMKNTSFSKKTIKFSHGTKTPISTTLPKEFNKWPKNSSSKSEDDKKIWIFFQNISISSICSYEHVECSFENPVENKWTKSWKFVDRSPNVITRP